jgi:hypothetical protein
MLQGTVPMATCVQAVKGPTVSSLLDIASTIMRAPTVTATVNGEVGIAPRCRKTVFNLSSRLSYWDKFTGTDHADLYIPSPNIKIASLMSPQRVRLHAA